MKYDGSLHLIGGGIQVMISYRISSYSVTSVCRFQFLMHFLTSQSSTNLGSSVRYIIFLFPSHLLVLFLAKFRAATPVENVSPWSWSLGHVGYTTL